MPGENIFRRDLNFIEALIALGIAFLLFIAIFGAYSYFRGGLAELVATVQCRYSSQTIENHVMNSLRRCDQADLYKVSNGNTLKLNFTVGQTVTQCVYEVDFHEENNMYVLTYAKNGIKTEIAQYLDGINGFCIVSGSNPREIVMVIRTKKELNNRKVVSDERTAVYQIRG